MFELAKLLSSACFRILLLVVAILSIACTNLHNDKLSENVFTQEEQALFDKRHKILVASGGYLPDYFPMIAVEGAQNYSPIKSSSQPEKFMDPKALDVVENYAAQSNAAALMVWLDGNLLHKSFGEGINDETLLVSRSLSKPLTGIAVGRAMQLGEIDSLDQKVVDFFNEWKGTEKEPITIRQLLNMTSGFLSQASTAIDADTPRTLAYISPRHEENIINDYPLEAAPSKAYLYSNAASDMIAVLIERATGLNYQDFVDQHLLKPLKMSGGEMWINRPNGVVHSGCCMKLPAETWLRLGILLLNEGVHEGEQILPKGFVAEMKKGSIENPHYGLGIWAGQPYLERRGYTGKQGLGPQVLHSEPYLDPDLFLFDGNGNQVVFISPKYRLVALRVGGFPPRSMDWDNALIPNTLIRALIP